MLRTSRQNVSFAISTEAMDKRPILNRITLGLLHPNQSVSKTSTCRLIGFGLAFIVLVMLFLPLITRAEEKPPEAVKSLASPEQMENYLDSALESHQDELRYLKGQLEELENLQDAFLNEIDTYDSQNTAHAHLLLMPQLRIENAEKALKENKLAYRTLTERVETLQKRYDAISILFVKAADRIEQAQKQIVSIRQSHRPDDQKQELESSTQNLTLVLKEKKQLGDRYLEIYDKLMKQIKSTLDENKALNVKLEDQLLNQKKISLFSRSNTYSQLSVNALPEEVSIFLGRFSSLFNPELWQAQWIRVKNDGFGRWVFFVFFLASIITLHGRFSFILQQAVSEHKKPDCFYRGLGLFLLQRSLPYFGMAILFLIYTFLELSLLGIGLGRVMFRIFLILMITRWGLDYLNQEFPGQPSVLRSFLTMHLKRFFRILSAIVIFTILLIWVNGRDNLLTLIAMDFSMVFFLLWTAFLWRQIKPIVAQERREGQTVPGPKWMALLWGWSYLVTGGALLISVAGYSVLAGFWIMAWTKTVAIIFWGWVSQNIILELYREHNVIISAADSENPLTSAEEFHWSLIKIARLIWFIILASGILWAWDSEGFLFHQLGQFFNLTASIGTLKFSVKGVVMGVSIIFVTYLAVHVGRSLLRQKILDKQSLEPGLKDSILAITSYLLWGLGLVLALGTIGVDATSLAMVFGAISIGIGFGLQNIFNNFISGLILLFERPIQVGDYVEVNGLWAQVKKINVRATVVQTFDNASVIIPNSEFISLQVTNWSFKDKRMRRSLEVGVAYGSDIELVQKTLLEIAQKSRNVLNIPKPDVLFEEHGDSALIFNLRIWVHVDIGRTVASEVRFEIDRRFRELAIEIPFPQQDVYIRTKSKEAATSGSADESDHVPPVE